MVAPLLHPGQEVPEGDLTVLQHLAVVVKILGGEQVGDCGNDDGGMSDFRLGQCVPEGNQISCFGECNGLILWVRISLLNNRQESGDIRVTKNMICHGVSRTNEWHFIHV